MWQLPRAWPILRRDPLAQVLTLWLSYFAIRAAVAAWEFPDLLAEQLDEVRRMARILLVLAVAWWVSGRVETMLRLLAVALVGLLLALVAYVEWNSLVSLLAGRARLLLGQNAQHIGLFFATAIVGWVVLAPRLLRVSEARLGRWASIAFWLATFFLLVSALLATQVRAAWLAILFWVAFYVSYQIWVRRRGMERLSGLHVLVVALAVASAVGLVAYHYEGVSERFAQEKSAITQLIAAGPQDAPLTSFGIRVRLWHVGLEKWSERKWFGWGPGTPPELIADSGQPRPVSQMAQFHNTPIEMLVRGGLVGLLLTLAVLLVLVRQVHAAWRSGKLPGDLAFFFASVLLLFIVVNFAEAYVDRQIGWIYFAFFAGLAYSFHLAPATQPADVTETNGHSSMQRQTPGQVYGD
ncbi:O-antigen ligase family protein [Ectothiorhodospiraceae bacterium 2226]|nr:O-antigen ligase family protein [Ectothiorhodospiraceae bacterium 2226]